MRRAAELRREPLERTAPHARSSPGSAPCFVPSRASLRRERSRGSKDWWHTQPQGSTAPAPRAGGRHRRTRQRAHEAPVNSRADTEPEASRAWKGRLARLWRSRRASRRPCGPQTGRTCGLRVGAAQNRAQTHQRTPASLRAVAPVCTAGASAWMSCPTSTRMTLAVRGATMRLRCALRALDRTTGSAARQTARTLQSAADALFHGGRWRPAAAPRASSRAPPVRSR